MHRRFKRSALLLIGAGVIAGVTAPIVIAAGDTDDHISPANTAVTASLKKGTASVLKGTVDNIGVTLTCKVSTTSFTTPKSGLPTVTMPPPTFSSCTDNASGTDTVKTNQTNGHWTITFLDAANDETTGEVTGATSGDKIKIGIPKAGVTIVSSFLPTCKITVAPNAAASVTGTYNDINTLTIKNAAVPTGGTGCTTGATGTQTSTYVATPGVHDVS
jgi:hypothetical protein